MREMETAIDGFQGPPGHLSNPDRVLATERLRESEERFRAFVTASSDVVYRMSPDWTEMRHPDICCGAAGLYSTLEPDMSNRILQEKLDDLIATRADVVAVANPGCQMQLATGLRKRGSTMKVEHVSELLARSF